jgi:hypothetical protein
MITKTTIVDQISTNADRVIFVRTATVIVEDGVELSKTYHRTSLVPGSDLEGQAVDVVAVANALWTPEVIAAYAAKAAETTLPV